jgi:hypothetical protein
VTCVDRRRSEKSGNSQFKRPQTEWSGGNGNGRREPKRITLYWGRQIGCVGFGNER